MPGRLFLDLDGAALAARLGVDDAHVAAPKPRQNISPGEQIATLGPDGLQLMRWGIIPVGRVNARGRPVMETLINARSETVFDKSAFEGVGRAVVTVTGWYEWTGESRSKIAWRITDRSGGLLYFAAISDVWKAPGGLEVPQVATLTCPPNADITKIHHRMGVLLSEQDVPRWLAAPPEEARDLLVPWPDGRLRITRADDVNWDAP